MQLKAVGVVERPLWVGLAEIRLNCRLREKISSVATPRCRWQCALPCASLRRPRCPSRGYLSPRHPMRFTELRNYGRSVSINGAAKPCQQRKSEQFKENREWNSNRATMWWNDGYRIAPLQVEWMEEWEFLSLVLRFLSWEMGLEYLWFVISQSDWKDGAQKIKDPRIVSRCC